MLLKKPNAYLDKMLKIRVVSTENDNVKVNLPIKLVKLVLMAGHSIAASIPQSEKYVKDIDINLIVEAIENELDGQIVDIKSANGDTVSVIIE
jgi:ribosomal protein S12